MDTSIGKVLSLSRSSEHSFSKQRCERLTLIKGIGVEGDAHAGETVKHRSRVAADPTQPNLRQVHLIHSELFDELAKDGYKIAPGDLGENVLTSGLDLLSMPVGTVLKLGSTVEVELTGLRNPCKQIETFRKGLLSRMLDKDEEGNIVRKTGVMGIVLQGGEVSLGDTIQVTLPAEPHRKMERV